MNSLHFLVSGLLGAGAALCVVWALRRPAVKPIHFVRSWRAMTPAEMHAAFSGWTDSDPRWRAMWDLLSTELEGALADIHNTGASPEQLGRWAGRIEMLLQWRAQLLNMRGKPGET